MTAAEAAALIKNGDNIAMSGFTPRNWLRLPRQNMLPAESLR